MEEDQSWPFHPTWASPGDIKPQVVPFSIKTTRFSTLFVSAGNANQPSYIPSPISPDLSLSLHLLTLKNHSLLRYHRPTIILPILSIFRIISQHEESLFPTGLCQFGFRQKYSSSLDFCRDKRGYNHISHCDLYNGL